MPLITWTDDMSVGVHTIDTDHKLLVSLLNQLSDEIDNGQGQESIGSVLNALIDYTGYHFAREEEMMDVTGYPDLEQHRKSHEKLKEHLLDIQRSYLSKKSSIKDTEVLDFLKYWLMDHIRGIDMKYASHMKGKDKILEKANNSFMDRLAGDAT